MSYRVFQYPLPAPPELDDLNAWLESHRIVSVQHHVVPQPGGSMLVFVVQSAEGSESGSSLSSASKTHSRSWVDYKKVLDEETFARFSQLREVRKQLAAESGVPVYTLFTNEQLADMARCHPATLTKWKQIRGIGDARIEKYGASLLAALEPAAAKKPEPTPISS